MITKAKKAILILFTVVLLTTIALGDREHEREREQERQRRRQEGGHGRAFEDLEPRSPKQYFSSEGGRLEKWTSDEFGALGDANMAAARFTLNPRGLLLPRYIDSHQIKVVTTGSARMGLILPFGDRAIERNVYRVQKGDVIAVPKGVPTWWYNDGDERTEIIAIAETSFGEEPGYVQEFYLAGSQGQGAQGSVLRGFDREILARAWNVDEQTVSRILDSQKGSSVVRVREGIEMPEVTEGNEIFADFVYRLQGSQPDYRAERGGQFHVVNRYKLPVLKHLDLAMTCVKLEPNAIAAPDYLINGHQVIYVVKGSGRIQIIQNNGEKALDTEVREGSLIVIPRLYPVAKIAGRDGLDFLSVSTSDMPFFQYLAGRNSVFKGIPLEVVARSFNIDEDLERKVRERRSEDAIIFPPRSERERRSRHEGEPRHTSVVDEASKSILRSILGF